VLFCYIVDKKIPLRHSEASAIGFIVDHAPNGQVKAGDRNKCIANQITCAPLQVDYDYLFHPDLVVTRYNSSIFFYPVEIDAGVTMELKPETTVNRKKEKNKSRPNP
jgi:hypothetical protein